MKYKSGLILLFIVVLLSACQSSSSTIIIEEATQTIDSTPTPLATSTATPVPQPYSQEDYSVIADFTFAEGEDPFYYANRDADLSQIIPEPGILAAYPQFKFTQNLGIGYFLRFKLVGEDSCYFFQYGAGIAGCNERRPNLRVYDGGSFKYIVKMQGNLIFHADQWIEMYMWQQKEQLNDATEVVFYSMIWDADDPSTYILYKAILPHYYNNSYRLGTTWWLGLEMWSGESNFDTIRLIGDDHLAFLWFNAEGFRQDEQEIVQFYKTDLQELSVPFITTTQRTLDSEISDFDTFHTEIEMVSGALLQWSDFNFNAGLRDFSSDIRVDVTDPDQGLQMTQTISSTDDGLLMVVDLLQTDVPLTNQELEEKVRNNYENMEIFTYAPLVGDASLAFETDAFIRFAFTKQNYLVEISCTGSYSKQCRLDSLAAFAQAIYDRLLQDYVFPDHIPFPSTWHEGDLILEGYPIVKEGEICYFLTDWVNSVQIVKYAEFENAVKSYQDLPNVQDLGIGEHCFRAQFEGHDDEFYSYWILVDGKIVSALRPDFE